MCNYCKKNEYGWLTGDTKVPVVGIVASEYPEGEVGLLEGASTTEHFCVRINYCPMCGRKFEVSITE